MILFLLVIIFILACVIKRALDIIHNQIIDIHTELMRIDIARLRGKEWN